MICYTTITLCTAYKSTVQTEQTVTPVMESGYISNSGIYTHGTVVDLLLVGVFVSSDYLVTIPPHF